MFESAPVYFISSTNLLKCVRKGGVDRVGNDDGEEAAEEGDYGEYVEVEGGEGSDGGEEESQLRGEDGPQPGHDRAGAQGGRPQAGGEELGRDDVGQGEAGGGAELAQEGEGGL